MSDRPLQLFSWDCIRFDVTQACATITHPGQLAAAARYNYDSVLGTIAVTQANQYDSTTGLLSRRDDAVGSGVVGGVTLFAGQDFFFSQTHNDLGLLDTLTYPCRSSAGGCVTGDPGRSISHGYANGQMISVGSWASNMTWRPNGMIDTITHGSGAGSTLEKWEADPNGMARPRRIYSTNASGTQELWSTGNYEFDGSGNIKKIGNTSYAYDPFGRLSSWTSTSPSGASGGYSTTTRGYDEFGNHLYSMESGCGPTPNPRCYSTSFLPREMRGVTNRYNDTTYDSAGNIVLDAQQRVYTWDPLGMMTSATVDGRTFRYLYDAGNERIAAVDRVPVGAVVRNRTTFTLRGSSNQLLTNWTDDWTGGTRVFTRKDDTIWRGSQLLARADGSSAMNYALDHLGSPRLITNGSGSVLDVQNFEPFGGGGLYGSGALQFTGHERDQANLGNGVFDLPDYLHARFYDKAGRFLSVDPVLDSALLDLPQSWNRYSYTLNNPMRYTDPAGLKPCTMTLPDRIEVEGGCIDVEAPDPEVTPWEVGWEWLTGIGPRDRQFTDGDKMTEMLKEHPHVQEVAKQVCDGSLPPEDSAPYKLSGLAGVPKYLRDYSTLATGGLTGNLTVTYLGSFGLSYVASGGGVNMQVTNSSSAASALRPPVIGYTQAWQQNVGSRINQFFSSGPMSKTTQEFNFTVPCQ